jgi:hypothetical protein
MPRSRVRVPPSPPKTITYARISRPLSSVPVFVLHYMGWPVPHHSYKGCPHISDAEYIARYRARTKLTESGCWLWQGFVQKTGYGDVSYRGRQRRIHRVMYEICNGPLIPGLDVCHSCDNPSCINPAHLWQGTTQENMRDASAKGRIYLQRKTHCLRGHEFTPENTRVYGNRHGHTMRKCLECQRLRNRKSSDWKPMRKYGRERDKKRSATQEI